MELLLALVVGLVLVLGGSQVLISSRVTYASHQAAMLLQDDARFVLGKMIQDIRQAGMFGCLAPVFIENAPPAFERPVSWSAGDSSKSLTLVTADVGDDAGHLVFGTHLRNALALVLGEHGVEAAVEREERPFDL